MALICCFLSVLLKSLIPFWKILNPLYEICFSLDICGIFFYIHNSEILWWFALPMGLFLSFVLDSWVSPSSLGVCVWPFILEYFIELILWILPYSLYKLSHCAHIFSSVLLPSAMTDVPQSKDTMCYPPQRTPVFSYCGKADKVRLCSNGRWYQWLTTSKEGFPEPSVFGISLTLTARHMWTYREFCIDYQVASETGRWLALDWLSQV